MKKIYFYFLFLFSVVSTSQTISVNTTTYTVPQLVEDILINSSCALVSNFTSSPSCGIGYFEYAGTNFDFSAGMILRNGNVNLTSGPYLENISNLSSECSLSGDIQLQNISDANGGTQVINDVTFVQFDFTPLTDTFSFNYIFASNEYGEFQCEFSDVFAFILTDLTTNTSTNLAVIPNSTTPVSVTTIRNAIHNFAGETCSSANPLLFDTYNVGNTSSVMNMRGFAVPMTASATVIPNRVYRIKLAIGDYRDSSYDSAVFIEAGSFNVGLAEIIYDFEGVNQSADMTNANGFALCQGASKELKTGLTTVNNTFVWLLNNEILTGENGPNLVINQPGTYCVEIDNVAGGGCSLSDCLIVEINSGPAVSNQAVSTCSDSALDFNLDNLVTGTGETYTYTVASSNQANVPAGPSRTVASAANITDTYTNTTNAVATITYTITPIGANGCVGNPFNLVVTVNPEPVIANQVASTCSSIALDFNLGDLVTGTGDTYTYTVASSDQANVPAGASRTVASDVNITDTYTSNSEVTITYTITPISADGCVGNPFDLVVTVNPEPVVANQAASTCSDIALDFNLGNLITGTGDTYTYTVASSNQANVPAGDSRTVASDVNITDTYTNTTNAVVTITYTITPIGPNGCVGNPFNLVVTVNPEPVVSNQAVSTCSDSALDFNLDNLVTGTGDTYTYTVASSNQTAVPAGASRTVASAANITDTYTNTTNAVVTITYTITPIGANGCTGNPFNLVVTVNPEPVVANDVLSTCSSIALDFNLGNLITGTGDTYTYTVISSDQANVPAGPSRTVASSANITDTYTSNTVVTITYTITPIGANGCVGNPFDLVVTVNPEPVVANQVASTCSDIALDFNLGNLITGTGDTYTYTVASSNQANVPAGPSRTVASSANITDTYTNTTNAVVTITYTITPIGANGCVGNPFNLVVTVNLEPVVANQAVATCSGIALNFNLGNLVTGTGDTYTYTVASSNQANVPAGASRTVASAANITDTYTNTTNAVVTITYTITPIGANGCTGNPFNLVVTVEPVATVVATPASQVICTGSSTSINLSSVTVGTSPITYQWTTSILTAPNGGTITGFSNNTSGNLNVISQILQNTGTSIGVVRYTITPFNGLCAGNPINVDVTVNPQGRISAINNQIVCNGNQTASVVFATTNTTGITTYTWTNNNPAIGLAASSSGNATGILNFAAQNTTNAPITGTITVTPTFTNGGISCVGAPITFTITVNPSPTLSLTSLASTTNQTLCVNTPITPIQYTFGSGATGVDIIGLPADLDVTTTGNMVTISGTPTTTVPGVFNYTITATGNTCGAPVLGGTITLTDGIQPFFNQVDAVCEGVTPNLPTSSNNSIPITGSWTQTGATASSITFEFTPDENQCALPGTTMTVQINPRPAVVVDNIPLSNTICSGESINLLLSSLVPNATFSWNSFNANGVSGHSSSTIGTPLSFINQTLTLNPGVTTPREVIYYIYAEADDCLGEVIEVSITVNPVPNVVVKGDNPSTICSGETTDIYFEGSVTGTIFNWVVQSSTGVSGAFDSQGSVLAQQLTTTGLSQGQVVYVVTPRFNGCTGASVSVTVFVNPLPQFFGDNSNHPQLCSGVDFTSIAFSSPNPNTIYSYTVTQVGVTGATNGTFTGQDLLIAQLLTTTTTIQGYVDYEVTATLNGCSATSVVVRVYVNPLPRPVLENGTICVDSDNITFQTYLLNTGLAESLYDFVWFIDGVEQLNVNTSTFVANVVGTYSVIATNTLTGCKSAPVSAIVTAIIPASSLTVTQSEYFSENAIITVNVTGGTGTLLYQLDEGVFQESNVFTGVSPGLHIVTVIDEQGCTFLTQEVLVIYYPKYFTPNGDGHNDTWNIIGLNQADAKLYIFDRYGKLLKQLSATNNSKGWDGTYNGHLLPSTDYWFSIDYKENGVAKVFKAHFSMKR